MKILSVIGARPQIIKAAALSRTIQKHFKNEIQEYIVHTGQHYDENMSDVFFRELGIPQPNINLNIGSGQHGKQTAGMIEGIEKILLDVNPDYLVLYGDTNSTLAGAVAASKLLLPIVHVEAGLRSFNKTMPEEINRIVCDHCSSILFSPTIAGINNLKLEGFKTDLSMPFSSDKPGVFHCGDIMYDNSLYFAELAEKQSNILQKIALERNSFILSTIHRNQNTDDSERLKFLIYGIAKIALAEKCKVVLPLHPRTQKMMEKYNISIPKEAEKLFHIIPPVSFLDMIMLEKNSKLILTDSGGVQKEAYFFKKPSVILRPETEWVEVVENRTACLIADTEAEFIAQARHFLQKPPKEFPNIFGNGKAAEFICKIMLDNFNSVKN